MSILQIQDLTMRFGGLTAVNKVNLDIDAGKIFSIIGPNGAGKTTVFNAITGIYEPTEGKILFQGRDPAAPMTSRLFASLIGIALLIGVGSLLAFNIESSWQAAINKNFVYQKAFPWGKAAGDFIHHITNQSPRRTWIPLAAGAAIGFAGGFAVWRRTRRTPTVIAREGIARTFQNIRLFQEMTVLENVLAGMDYQLRSRFWHAALRLPAYWIERRRSTRRAMELLRFVELEAEAHQVSKNLSYGDQRRLEIARALATNPKVLLLDEPAAGMNPVETIGLMELIRKIRDTGMTILLIEHHMRVVMGISDRIAVLDYGQKIAEGTPAEISSNPRVIEAYLGKEEVG